MLLMEILRNSPVTAAQIQQWIDKDPLHSRVRTRLLHGWINGEEDEMTPCNNQSKELSMQDGCVLLWSSPVVVPERGRKQVLQQLHEGHPGISRMKGIARSITWWPNIHKEVDAMVRDCSLCQQQQKSPVPAPLHS